MVHFLSWHGDRLALQAVEPLSGHPSCTHSCQWLLQLEDSCYHAWLQLGAVSIYAHFVNYSYHCTIIIITKKLLEVFKSSLLLVEKQPCFVYDASVLSVTLSFILFN